MNQLLQDSRNDARNLEKQMISSHKNIIILKQFFKEIQDLHESFANSLKESSEKFYHAIMQEEEEEEALLYCYNYICHYTLNLTHLYTVQASNIQNRILEPFDLFAENFNETNKTLMHNATKLLDSLQETKLGVCERQEAYYKASKEYEKYAERSQEFLKRADKGPLQREHFNMVSYQASNRKDYLDQCTEEYKLSVVTMNQKWENYEIEFGSIFENFDLNEESKLNFTKMNISQIIKSLNDLHMSIKESCTTYSPQVFEKKVADIESKLSLKVPKSKKLLQSSSNMTKLVKREAFLSYDAWKKAQRGLSENAGKENPDTSDSSIKLSEKLPMDNLISYLIREKAKTKAFPDSLDTTRDSIPEELGHASEVEKTVAFFAQAKSRKYFLTKINQNSNKARQIPVKRGKWADFRKIASVLIQGFISSKDQDPESFYNLIEFLTKFYLEDSSKRIVYLISLFKNSVLWQDTERWENFLYYVYVKKKLTEGNGNQENSKELSEIINSNRDSTSETLKRAHSVSDLSRAGKIPIDQEASSKKNFEEKTLKLAAFDQVYLTLMQIDPKPEISSSILLKISKKIGIDNKTQETMKATFDKRFDENLRLEVTSAQRRHVKKLHKYGHLLAIYLSLEFLSNDRDLINVLLTCKQWNINFKRKIQKIALLSPVFKTPATKRVSLWKQRIELLRYNFDFDELKDNLSSVEPKPYIEDLIKLDVQRSFSFSQEISQESLEELLKLFARYNPEISYCQGMNYVVGFLYYQLRNEQDTFRFYVAIVEKMLSQVFENDLANIPFLFYLMDRIVAIFLPDLATHFRNQRIESNLYSSSWFITIFSNAFQFNQDSALLLAIWDLFAIEGWKGFYKSILALFEFYQSQLVKMKFDNLMSVLNSWVESSVFMITTGQVEQFNSNEFQVDIITKEELEEIAFVKNFKEIAQRFKVTSDLLQTLEASYNPKDITLLH